MQITRNESNLRILLVKLIPIGFAYFSYLLHPRLIFRSAYTLQKRALKYFFSPCYLTFWYSSFSEQGCIANPPGLATVLVACACVTMCKTPAPYPLTSLSKDL